MASASSNLSSYWTPSMLHQLASSLHTTVQHYRAGMCHYRLLRCTCSGFLASLCLALTPLALLSGLIFWHLGKPAFRQICTMSDIASARSLAVTRGSFLASARRELSVALVKSQGYVHRSCALFSPRLWGGRCCLGRTLPSLIESYVVCAGPVCRLCLVLLRLAYCCLVFLVAFGSVYSLPFIVARCVCFLTLVDCNGFAPCSLVTAQYTEKSSLNLPQEISD
jgi:hypothetical protein